MTPRHIFDCSMGDPAEFYSQSHVTCGRVKLVLLGPRTRLYHYLGLGQFMAWVESGKVALPQIKCWQDAWEQPIRRMWIETGEASEETWRLYDSPHGYSWTRSRESDAMWRLYSPDRRGLRIKTTAQRFSLLGGLKEAMLAPVWYTNEPMISALRRDGLFPRPGYIGAFLKRTAFRHENEVRLVVMSDQVDADTQPQGGILRLPLDPAGFVQGIALDPRAEDWYVEAVRRYCSRSGLKCIPRRSGLCAEDPLDAGLFPTSRQYLSHD